MRRETWTLDLPAGTDPLALRRALGAALGIDPVDARLEPAGDAIPTVVLVIEDGRAEISAVSGAVKIVHADMDREGETLSREEIDSILSPGLDTGTPDMVEKAIAEAREGLERFLVEDVEGGMEAA